MKHAVTITKLLLLPAVIGIGRSAPAATPTELKAGFRSGQVFITWKEVPKAKEYRVYRDTKPLTTGTLDESHLVRRVPQGSSANMGLASVAKRGSFKKNDPPFTIVRNVVTPLAEDAVGSAEPVGADEGVVVLTTHKDGRYHYAVTAVVNGAEDRALAKGNTAGPVAEKVQTPEPVLVWQSKIKCARLYLQYRDLDDWNDSMSNIYSFLYWVAVKKNHKPGPRTKALRVYLGGYSGAISGGDSAKYCDVTIRAHEAGCWWWGFSSTYQYDRRKYHHGAGSPKPTSGPMKNYVQARYVEFAKWVSEQPYYSVDPNAIHTFGGSMGGIGSLLMLMDYPDFYAYGQVMVPPTNPLGAKWQWLRNCEAKWGDASNSTLKVAFHGWGSDRLTKKFGGMTVRDFLNLEKRLEMFEGDDLPFIWVGSCGRDRSVNWPQQGRNFYTGLNKSRRAWAGGLKGGGGHFSMGGDGGGVRLPRQLRSIRKNQSFPAFSNVSGNPALPLPLKPENKFYQFNSQFIWSSPTYKVAGVQEQVDTPDRYELVIASIAGDQTADVTPRRLQNFKITRGRKYLLQNTDVKEKTNVLQSQTVIADKFGLVTFMGFQAKAGTNTAGGSWLVITPAR